MAITPEQAAAITVEVKKLDMMEKARMGVLVVLGIVLVMRAWSKKACSKKKWMKWAVLAGVAALVYLERQNAAAKLARIQVEVSVAQLTP